MRHRHAISDDDWARIKDLQPGQHGKVAKDNRLFIDAVLRIARAGTPWRDLPERFGNRNSHWRRFDRRARKGTWQRVFEALRDPDPGWLILDSTVIRAHPRAAGAPKNGTGPAAKPSKPSAVAEAGSGRRSAAASAASGCPSR